MTLVDPKTISDVFQAHGITVAICALILQIQELALAVTLKSIGRGSGHMAEACYQPFQHSLTVHVWARNARGEWGLLRRMGAALPTETSDQRQRELAIQDLGSIAEVLHQLLKEGSAS